MERAVIRKWAVMALLGVVLMAAGPHPDLIAAESPDDYRVISDKFIITLGSYITDFETDAAVGSDGLLGTFIRMEDELGITDDDSLFRVDGLYRFNRRHAIGFGFWTVNRDGAAVLGEDIDFDGNIFKAGVAVLSELDTTWLRIDWRYSFLRTDQGEAGISAGLSFYQFDIGVAGFATVQDPMGMGTIQVQTRSEDDLVAPVPTFGFFITYAITPNVVFRLKADFFDLNVDDFEGSLIGTTMTFDWYFSRHVGIGVGVTGSDLSFKSLGDDPFLVDYQQTGLVGYFTFAFGDVD